MDGIEILLKYFNIIKRIELKNDNNANILKKIDELLKLIEDAKTRSNKIRYIDSFNFIEELVKKYDASLLFEEIKADTLSTYSLNSIEEVKNNDNIPNYIKDIINNINNKGTDNILYDIMLNVNRYNIYFMNKKIKKQELPIDSDISILNESPEVDIETHVLPYIEADINELDNDLVTDLKRYADVDKFRNMATFIKAEIGATHALYEKIEDKNILASILLHSNIEILKTVCNIFKENNNASLSYVASNIPSIFIKNPINSRCKFDVLCHYDNFIENVKLIQNNELDFKRLVKFSVFLVNNPDKNKNLIERLQMLKVNVKNVLEHVGNIITIKPEVVFNNINTLALYGIELTDDNNNYGYSLLGMEELDIKLDYLIEQGLWKKSDGVNHDNIDLIRGLIIKDNYLKWKNNYKYDKLSNTSLENEEFSKEPFDIIKRDSLLERYPEIQEIESSLLNNEDSYYGVEVNGELSKISRNRVLRNLNNYKGKGDFREKLLKALNHQSNVKNSEEVFGAIKQPLEMGDRSVKLS